MYHYTFGGLRNVWLVNGYRIHQTPMGEAIAFADGEGLELSICTALCSKSGHLTGAEFRFVRTSGLRMSQGALGKLIGADVQAVARWEKFGRIPKWADKMIRLVYQAQQDGNQPIKQAIDRLNIVDRLVEQKIIMREKQGMWEPSIKSMDTPEEETC